MLTYDRALSLRIEEEKECLIYIYIFFHRPPSTPYLNILLEYLKDSNTAAHSVDTGISQSIERTCGNVV